MDKNIAREYVRKRKRRKRAAIITGLSTIGIIIFTIIAFCMQYLDRFTISTNSDPELCLTIDETKSIVVTQLTAPPLANANDAQYSDIPQNIDEGLGSKNTNQYFAYSFYLGGVGEAQYINYSLSVSLNRVSENIEKAMRVMIIKNGQRTIYAQKNEDGTPKQIYVGKDRTLPTDIIGTAVPFKDNKHIILEPYITEPGNYDKYTVVMWIDGWESSDSMRGGIFQVSMQFSTLSKK